MQSDDQKQPGHGDDAAPGRKTPVQIVVATKGRALETSILLAELARQSRPADIIVVVGTCAEDLPSPPAAEAGQGEPEKLVQLISPTPGTSLQRNVGIDWLQTHGFFEDKQGFVAFFDDDFRPHTDWLKGCEETFSNDPRIVGVTGLILADGIIGPGLTETEAAEFIAGTRSALPHWTDRPHLSPIDSVYGCNMAFRTEAVRQCRFDEALPLYGWQEDTDYTGRTRKFGLTVTSRRCVGVHMGVKKGRTSGVRQGYSQIANPLHIAKSGNMRWSRAINFVLRAMASNIVKSVAVRSMIDYPGRLRGNLIALVDLVAGRCKPNRILEL